ncbi:hypothetical protein [Mesorhizobium sp. WSM3876]|uniref:hypothetical protein n=1 Tax=Mesorhizobium sp. WSM3876 TaxID=422277 RepID=UPI000BB0C4E6|nr:hypothetical protein [Mesorhizobium sp. WSM3876]PBB83540.1 hypothetical protein CK216_28390 [Mesorhizobium sp. WSM3876]
MHEAVEVGSDLAEELSLAPADVPRWLDGRAPVPLAVAAWIEALVKAHKALPPPGLSRAKVTSTTGSAQPAARPEAVPAAAASAPGVLANSMIEEKSSADVAALSAARLLAA